MENRGVVYLSSIPPYMGKKKIKKLLGAYGDIDRVHLTPEPQINRTKRIKDGGNKRKSYVEGWVEYLDKHDAKKVALMFNGACTGGKKRRNFYREDIWNIRYLSKFTWEHLLQKIESDKMLTDQQVRSEATIARKANRFYADQVKKAKEITGIKKKRKRSKDLHLRDFKQKQPLPE